MLTLDGTASGGLFGAQIGYDWQMGRFVVGAIADIALSSHRANLSRGIGPAALSVGTGLDYLATVRARGGYTFDRALFYTYGGLDYQGRAGCTVGTGVGYALSNRLSIGTEYANVNLGSRDLFNNGAVQATETFKPHTVKASINYRFCPVLRYKSLLPLSR